MTVKDTSIEASKSRTGNSLEHQVLVELREGGPGTRYDISRILNKPINYITDPVNRLLKAGLIEETHKITQFETGAKAWVLRVKAKDD